MDDLHAEPELSFFASDVAALPSVAAAAANTQAAAMEADARRFALAPIIAGTFTETGSNASGFIGRDWSYRAALTATWSFDLTRIGDIKAQDAAVGATRARELRATLAARDAIHREWNTIAAGIARSRSARARKEAAFHAAEQARERYRAGTITQLDLLQAQRDAFNAEVSRIQADADLINARVQFRSSNSELLAEGKGPNINAGMVGLGRRSELRNQLRLRRNLIVPVAVEGVLAQLQGSHVGIADEWACPSFVDTEIMLPARVS